MQKHVESINSHDSIDLSCIHNLANDPSYTDFTQAVLTQALLTQALLTQALLTQASVDM